MLPALTTSSSPTATEFIGTSISVSPHLSQTFSTPKDIVLARSSTDLLCVHSSSNSPKPSMNITDEAVELSPLINDTAIAVASSKDVSILPFITALSASVTKPAAFFSDIRNLTGAGRILLKINRLASI